MPIVLKFGGLSLSNGEGIHSSVRLIRSHYRKELQKNALLPLVVVASARGRATLKLISMAEQAQKGEDYTSVLHAFTEEQQYPSNANLTPFFHQLSDLLQGVSLLHEITPQTHDAIVSLGECMSAATLVNILRSEGIPAEYIDGSECLLTDSCFGNAKVNLTASETRTLKRFAQLPQGTLPIVTGFIAADSYGRRTTLGRNAGNYSATLLANFLNADKVYNYTHVNGVFTADPNRVKGARKIDELSYTDAAELSQFGAKIIHHLAMEPLKAKSIPCHILNSFAVSDINDLSQGTLITAHPKDRSARALASVSGKALIHFEGRDMLGRVGIDARIFTSLGRHGISVSLVTQGASERGIAMVVNEEDADQAVKVLQQEFSTDLTERAITNIYAEKGMAIVSLIGINLAHFDRPYRALVRNAIIPVLVNNAVPGNTVCLLLHETEVEKALNVIHCELFERTRRIHIAVIGHGNVGSMFINQLLQQQSTLLRRKDIDLRLFAIADSNRVLLNHQGISNNWKEELKDATLCKEAVNVIIEYARAHHLENLVAIDNTASSRIPESYECLALSGFDLVSSNKIANTNSYHFYRSLRNTLRRTRKTYRYETNVGAGLPLIDNLRLLHLSGDRVTCIRGLFSGSLSYIFNQLSPREGKGRPFPEVLEECKNKGYLEPDPRIDLCGLDVARKVLILARELDHQCELDDVKIESLVPENLSNLSYTQFEERMAELAQHIEHLTHYVANTVVRFVGELRIDSEGDRPILSATLRRIPADSPLANSSGADSCFEIYTENYGTLPIVIQGAGAGAAVTAQGVFADLLRVVEK